MPFGRSGRWKAVATTPRYAAVRMLGAFAASVRHYLWSGPKGRVWKWRVSGAVGASIRGSWTKVVPDDERSLEMVRCEGLQRSERTQIALPVRIGRSGLMNEQLSLFTLGGWRPRRHAQEALSSQWDIQTLAAEQLGVELRAIRSCLEAGVSARHHAARPL